ncbi:hypothetical protein [Desulfatibacillum aliphaticivorans]|uniref:hypothetical protein n=1 Tax=Desulfatibacillum aliphaticivorans TaxID=218208 RepID=UPI0012FA7D41|nr:hypothetical protein [Desulfatibacillum aliphaticivorans]
MGVVEGIQSDCCLQNRLIFIEHGHHVSEIGRVEPKRFAAHGAPCVFQTHSCKYSISVRFLVDVLTALSLTFMNRKTSEAGFNVGCFINA